MVFSSPEFLFLFLPLTLLLYYLIPVRFTQARNIELLIASLIFYSWGEPKNILLMLLSIAVNYCFGLLLESTDKAKWRKLWMILSVVFNLGLLFFFKYFNFVTGGRFGTIALPIGISFFTFQIMSYTIDVYWKNVQVQTNICKLGLYISLFPQLIAGPIVRYIDVAKELDNRSVSAESAFRGVVRFSVGLAKKVVLSNTVSMLCDQIFDMMANRIAVSPDSASIPMATAWLGAIAYTLQIYFDFSGYSDMAIGMGDMLGFHFPENFNYPYISGTMQEFWRRWHMTLSTWFKDYLYIPLGGNRKGKLRTYINLIIVFACTGFWHGASWNFLVWGLYHGFFLVIERIGFKKILQKLPAFVRHIYTLFFVIIGWVIFRADDMTQAIKYIASMFRFSNFGWVNAMAQFEGEVGKYTIIVLLLAIAFSIPWVPKLKQKLLATRYGDETVSILSGVFCIALLLLSVFCMTGLDYNPFIYFRF